MKAVLAVLVFVLKAVGAVLAAVIVLAALILLLKVGVEAHVRKDDDSDGSVTDFFLRIGVLKINVKTLSAIASRFGGKGEDKKESESKVPSGVAAGDGANKSADSSAEKSACEYAVDEEVGGGEVSVAPCAEKKGAFAHKKEVTLSCGEKDEEDEEDEISEVPEIPEIPEIPEEADIPEVSEGMEKLSEIAKLAAEAAKRLWGYVDIEVKNLDVVIATPDAADTAILYGEVCAAVNGILAYLANFKNIRTHKGKLSVRCDFYSSESLRFDLDASLSFRLWQLALTALRAVLGYVKVK